MLRNEEKVLFGDYEIHLQEEGHAVITRVDLKTPTPNFYEMQCMKNMAFGGAANAIEVFPPSKKLVDGEEQRHLWLVDYKSVPNLDNISKG